MAVAKPAETRAPGSRQNGHHSPQGEAPLKNSQDPYAFSMSNFAKTDSDLRASQQKERQQRAEEKLAGPVSTDPFAFDMAAFGGDSQESGAAQTHRQTRASSTSKASDPYAFNPEAFDNDPGGPNQELSKTRSEATSAADPFAFDASAFGAEFQPPPGKAAASSSEPEHLADPYAFDMSAFGRKR